MPAPDVPQQGNTEPDQGVRFSSVKQEIAPDPDAAPDLPPETERELLQGLSSSLKKSNVQAKRLQDFNYEPMSLPPSRPASPSPGSKTQSRASSGKDSPRQTTSPLQGAPQSPPLTPAASDSRDPKPRRGHGSAPNLAKHYPKPTPITPQMSGGQPTAHAQKAEGQAGGAKAPTGKSSSRPGSRPGSRPVSPKGGLSVPDTSGVPQYMADRACKSVPHSRETSPDRRGSVISPTSPGRAQPGDSRDQNRGPERRSIFASNREIRIAEQRASEDRRRSGIISSLYGPQKPSEPEPEKPSTTRQTSESSKSSEQRKHGIFSGLYHAHDGEEHSSKHDLKRFFKFGGHKHKHDKHDKQEKPGRSGSPAKKVAKSGTETPPPERREREPSAVPFADDHGLESKYGKFDKVLGSGAGGSVRLMKRSSDGTTFAVKQFRPRHTHETEREYNKKVTAEFCVGSTLHHGNIIETMDIFHEKNTWYEVMEYAPYDLFAIVMTGKMSREEVTCCTMQILAGVTYLHDVGLAHRDLKLDNVVVNEYGIMKLIDFGSAVVFQYPNDDKATKASGIVGSDPYLAPEVYEESKYDPQAVDVWSLGIIFCCMSLRRFPWKLPRVTDVSYKYFVADATPGTPSIESLRRKPSIGAKSSDGESAADDGSSHHHHWHHNKYADGHHDVQVDGSAKADGAQGKEGPAQGSVKGPWRLLRLLPRESRYIIGRMLDTDPTKRASLEEIHDEPWFATRTCCRQEENGTVVRAEGHDHVLEPGGTTANEVAAKKKP